MAHRMPIKNGLESTKEILNIDKRVKIHFLNIFKNRSQY